MKPYPAYKQSGVPWLGKVPRHWDILPLFRSFEEQATRNDPAAQPQVLSLSYGRIVPRNVETNEGLLPATFDSYQKLFPGDVVLRLTDLQNDQRSLRVGYVEQEGIITSAYLCLRSVEMLTPRYAYHFLNALDLLKVFYGLGGGVRQSIDFFHLRRIPTVTPPLDEQRAITAYLDAETARIDALIAEKERLIETLREYRQTVISETVSRGLNPTAPVKPSGMPWLGEMPKHWTLCKLGRFVRIGNGSTPLRDDPSYWGSESIPWLNSAVVNDGEVHEAADFVSAKAISECHLPMVPPGSVLVALTGQGKTRGTAALLMFPATINQHLAFITPDPDKLHGDFLRWYLTSQYGVLRMVSDGAGSTKGALTCEDLGRFPVLIPPLSEQQDIVRVIDAKTKDINALIACVQDEIELLRELRSSTITDAVLGRFRVA